MMGVLALLGVLALVVIAAVVIANSTSKTVVHYKKVVAQDRAVGDQPDRGPGSTSTTK